MIRCSFSAITFQLSSLGIKLTQILDKTGPSLYSQRQLGSQDGAQAVFYCCMYIRVVCLCLCVLRACISSHLGVGMLVDKQLATLLQIKLTVF